MKPLLALDFDGVICDSLDECLVTAVNTRRRMRGKKELLRTPGEVDPDLAARFRAHRHLVRPAGEYETLLHWLATRDDDPTPAEFAALCRQRAADVIAFQPVFFYVRTALRNADPEAWTALHRRYGQATAGWSDLCASHEVHLVTTKDLASVRHFNHAWSLGLADDRLHTCERFVTKAAAIEHLAARHGAAPASVTFVDDHPGHLADVAAATGARCLWARWGYSPASGGAAPIGHLAEIPLLEGVTA